MKNMFGPFRLAYLDFLLAQLLYTVWLFQVILLEFDMFEILLVYLKISYDREINVSCLKQRIKAVFTQTLAKLYKKLFSDKYRYTDTALYICMLYQ